MSIILFGFKGCGKTYHGKRLSLLLNLPFIDTDDLIVKLYGEQLPIREIHSKLGEEAFRSLEAKAIHQLQASLNAVIALGGGAVLNPVNVGHLQNIGQLVYLKASFETIKERILKEEIPSFVDATRPFESLKEIYEKRILIYEKIPAQWMDVD
ncbi:MAG: shikimate kinase [Chlamydiales bacterium]|nr:shikimate kinase [Chlamydiales bacterium]